MENQFFLGGIRLKVGERFSYKLESSFGSFS